jgi:hypothetical protein
MARIADQENLERWLKKQNYEPAVVLAARGALRVMPLLMQASSVPGLEARTALFLPSFRALAAAWAAVPKQYRAAYEAAVAAHSAERAVYASSGPGHVAARVAAAASAAARAAAAASAAISARDEYANDVIVGEASRAATANDDYDYRPIWRAITLDIDSLQAGVTPALLLERPLWPPAKTPDWAIENWERLKQSLPEGENWQVWTDWYDARLRGGHCNGKLEAARVLEVTQEEWEAGPTVANAKIKRIIERFQSAEDISETSNRPDVPEQSSAGLQFTAAPGAPIDLLVASPSLGFQSTLFSEVRRKSNEAAALCGHGSNALRNVAEALQALNEALAPEFDNVDILLLWSRVNSLRRLRNADDDVRRQPDPDRPPWAADIRAALDDITDTANALIAGDERARELDQLSRDPKTATGQSNLKDARQIVDAAKRHGNVATPGALSRLNDALARAEAPSTGEPYPAELDAQFASRSALNFAIVALQRTFVEVTSLVGKVGKEAAKAVLGTGVAAGTGLLVAENAATLHAFVRANGDIQALHQLIEFIAKFFV